MGSRPRASRGRSRSQWKNAGTLRWRPGRSTSAEEMTMMCRQAVRSLLVFFALFFGVTAGVSAVTCTSRQDGNWNTAATWNCGGWFMNGPPAAGDVVVVRGNDDLTLNTSTPSLASLTINAGGSITGDNNSRTLNLAGNLVNNGDITLTAGTSGIVMQ
eukprot:RCo032743